MLLLPYLGGVSWTLSSLRIGTSLGKEALLESIQFCDELWAIGDLGLVTLAPAEYHSCLKRLWNEMRSFISMSKSSVQMVWESEARSN